MAKTVRLTESELKNMIIESVKKILKEGQNDEPSNTHYAVHKPTHKIVFAWDYNGYDSYELGQYRKDYFVNDLVDMGMDPQETAIWTRRTCMTQGIDPTNDSNWSNYPMTESYKKINKARTSNEIKTIVLSIGDFDYNNEELDEWIGDNWDNLPTEDVEITIYFKYIPEDKGDYWTPPSGGYIELNDIEFNDNPLMQYLKQELSTEFVQTIMATIESYVEENVDELVQYQEEDGPDPDAWREDYLLRKYGY